MADRKKGDRRKTKLEKIYELQSKVEILKEEKKRLKEELDALKGWEATSIQHAFPQGKGNRNEEKLKEALRSLKRVTVKQEMSLSTMRAKARQRRSQLESKDAIILDLETELDALKKTNASLVGPGGDDVSLLRAKVGELQMRLTKAEAHNDARAKNLDESKLNVNSLRTQLDSMKGKVQRNSSSQSIRSSDSTSTAMEDVSRLKRELARKTEKIANLEHDLEDARDTIHDLKQRDHFASAFPSTPAPGMDDFFSDDEDDDDVWGT